MNNNESKLTIGVDVGGTFTDFLFYDFATDHLSANKILTDAGAPDKTILEGIRRGLARLSGSGENIQSIIHGTTLVVNAVIERKGAKTGLLTTKGFRDILEARKEKPAEVHLFPGYRSAKARSSAWNSSGFFYDRLVNEPVCGASHLFLGSN